MKLDFITVVYREEIGLLRIQAQSFNQYLSHTDVGEIVIVINDEQHIKELIDPNWWGQLSDRVKVIHHSALGLVINPHIQGWYTQQICKLLATKRCESAWSMVFDAKTWLVRALDTREIFDHVGRPVVGHCPISTYWKDSKIYLEQMYGITMNTMLGPGGVPFMLHTETTNALVDSIDNFPEWFQSLVPGPGNDKMFITEFMLYSAYVFNKYGVNNRLYSDLPPTWHPNNMASWEVDKFKKFFDRGALPSCLTVSIHKDCYRKLSAGEIATWLDFLERKHIIQHDQRGYVNLYRK